MADERHSTAGAVNVETRHETSDVNVRALLWFVAIFLVFAVITHVGLWLLFRFYVQIGRGAAANAPMTSVARPVDANVPPEPRLQPFPNRDADGKELKPTANTPVSDMIKMREAEDAVLKNYGWVDRNRGVVHIPIDDAKGLALQGGFAVVANPGAHATPTLQAPAQSAEAGPAGSATPATSTSPSAAATQPATTTAPREQR